MAAKADLESFEALLLAITPMEEKELEEALVQKFGIERDGRR